MNEGYILLVEDNPDHAMLAKRALKRGNVSNLVVHAADGQEALDLLFADKAELPAMILLDLKLPRVDGLEVLARIRAEPRTHRVPVVILTSSDEERDRAVAYDRSVNSYIRKPVDYDSFVRAVNQIGLYWLVHNTPPPETP